MNRIYAGIAGGKRYFYGDQGKLYDEAGVEQTDSYAAILKANFPPPPNTNTPNQQSQPDPNQPQRPNYQKPSITKQAAADILKIAFPDLYDKIKKIQAIKKKRDKKKKGQQQQGQKKKNDSGGQRKQWERELSLKVEAVGSNVRTNGELLRQQLTMHERSIELLTKISQGQFGGKDKENDSTPGPVGKLKSTLGALKKFIIPTLGALGVAAAGGTALYMSRQDKQHNEDTVYNDEFSKYGEEKANALKANREESTLARAKRVWDTADTRKPAERAAAQRAQHQGIPSQPGDTQKNTRAIAEAKERKPAGKTVDIKADQLNFEAKTIKLEARTITINAASSSTSSGGSGGGGGAQAQENTPPQKADGGQQDNSQPNYDAAGNPTGTRSDSGQNTSTGNGTNATPGNPTYGQGKPDAGQAPVPSDGMVPAGAQFKPEITTPNSVGSGNTKAPGFGGVTGGQGAELLGKDNVYDPKNTQTPDSIRKNDIVPTQGFKPTAGDGKKIENGSSEEGTWNKRSDIPYNGTQASIRYNNPGAAWPRKGDDKWGILGKGHLADGANGGTGNWIGRFPTSVHGMAANMDLLNTSNKYQGQTIRKAVENWTNNGRHGVPGFDPNHILTRADTNNPEFMKAWMNETRKAEGPKSKMTKAEIDQAWDMYKSGSADNYMKAQQKTSKPGFTNANAQNTKNMIGGDVNVGDLGTMFGKTSMTDVKGMGGIEGAAKEMDKKGAALTDSIEGDPTHIDNNLKQNKAPFVNETNIDHPMGGDVKGPPTKFTDELIENKLNEEAGMQRWLGWKQIGPGQQRRQQLNKDPWATEPGFEGPRPLDSINAAPGEIPDAGVGKSGGSDGGPSGGSDEDPPEKSEGSKSRISDHVSGSKKPKPIRKVDMDKYYPQYPKSEAGSQEVGIGVA